MAHPTSWRCPYCQHTNVLSGLDHDTDTVELFDSKNGITQLVVEQWLCRNCHALTLEADWLEVLKSASTEDNFAPSQASATLPRQNWKLLPDSGARPQPDFIPQRLRDDYVAACRIVSLSPEAAATLARRVLQGIIRDFHRVTRKTLNQEIDALKNKVNADIWETIDSVRRVGNVRAHMEGDVNVIAPADPDEAQSLISLVEQLFDKWYVARHDWHERKPDTAPRRRSKLARAAFVAVGLLFFFGVGMALGTVYNIYFRGDAGAQLADPVSPPPSETAASPGHASAANTPNAQAQAAPDLASIDPVAPPAFAYSPAPTVTPQPKPAPTTVTDGAQPTAPSVAEAPPLSVAKQALQVAAIDPAATHNLEAAPALSEARAESHAEAPRFDAIPSRKPALTPKTELRVAKAVTPDPKAGALSNAAGSFRVQFGTFSSEDNARRLQVAFEATGFKTEIRQEASPSGQRLFFVRSPSYPDRASALSAAQSAQNRVQRSANANPIAYVIVGDHPQQTQP